MILASLTMVSARLAQCVQKRVMRGRSFRVACQWVQARLCAERSSNGGASGGARDPRNVRGSLACVGRWDLTMVGEESLSSPCTFPIPSVTMVAGVAD